MRLKDTAEYLLCALGESTHLSNLTSCADSSAGLLSAALLADEVSCFASAAFMSSSMQSQTKIMYLIEGT